MAIKEVLELVGSDVVIKQLNDVKKAGEESLATFNKPLPELKFPELPAGGGKPIEELSGQTLKLKDALHALHPILQAAGVQIGEFGAFARLASGSVAGLATALIGAVVVGLAKLEENAARTKGQLTDLFGSTGKGEQAFAALEKQAVKFGTTVEGLAPGLESFQTALNNVDRTAKGFVALKAEDLPGASLAKNVDSVTDAYSNFIKILRAGRLSQSDAEKSAKSFFDAMREGGPVTKAALQGLPVGTLQLLKEALGAAGLTSKAFFEAIESGRISLDQMQSALANFGPQSERAFQTKAIKSFSDELGKILVTLGEGFKKLSGGTGFSDFVLGELKRIREGISSTITDVDNLVAVFKFLQSFGKTQFQASVGAAQQAIMDSLVKPQQGFDEAGFTDLGKTAAKAFGAGWINAPESKQVLSDINKTFRDAPGIKDAIKLPPVDKTDFEKSLDEAGKKIDELKKKVQDDSGFTLFGPKGIFPSLDELKGMLGGGAGGVPPLAATPGLSLLSLFGGGQGGQQAQTPENLTAPFQQASDQIKQIWTALMQFISTSVTTIDLSSVTQALVAPFQNAVPLIQQTLLGVSQAVDDLLRKLQQAAQSASQLGVFAAGGGIGGIGHAATGGMVRGPGSGTSDSILAWLSNREFVVNAKAVSHYGPDFFSALNSMRLPMNVGHFNMGGLARVLGNKFAGGGMVSSGGNRSLTLVLNQKSFSLTGSKGTIDDLEREASLRGLAMIGKAPSWIR